MPKSSLAKRTIVPDSWRAAQSDPTLLLRMAADAKRASERAARIAELRNGIRDPETGKKLSQERLAAEIRVSSRSVQNWEHGGELEDQNRKVLAEYFTRKHGRILTEDFIEYGVMSYDRGETPELLPTPAFDVAARLLERLAAIEEQLALLQANNEERHAELLKHIDERTEPIQDSARRQRRA